jgi:GT2 family glycosyltransferase
MKYSLITLGWKSLENIQNVIADAYNSTLLPEEIIVVINNYDPVVAAQIKDYVSTVATRYVYCSQNIGIATAFNLGMNISTTDIFVIVNDDCRVGPETYERMVAEFKDVEVGNVGVIAGGKAEDSRPSLQGFLIAHRREMIEQMGGYLQTYSPLACERELCLRGWTAGWKSVVAPHCLYHHVHDVSNFPDQVIPYLSSKIVPSQFVKQNEPQLDVVRDFHNALLAGNI